MHEFYFPIPDLFSALAQWPLCPDFGFSMSSLLTKTVLWDKIDHCGLGYNISSFLQNLLPILDGVNAQLSFVDFSEADAQTIGNLLKTKGSI